MIDVEILDAPAPVIPAAVELEDVEALLDEGDEGQKIFALQPVLVEIVGRIVGGGDDDDAVVEQGLEETAEQHGIGDVLDLKLVEAEKADLLGYGPRQGRDGIAARLAPPAMEGLMDTFSMKALKWTRRFLATGAPAKNMSISMDLPVPTLPKM